MLSLERVHFLAAGELMLFDLETIVVEQLQSAAAVRAFMLGQDHSVDDG
jgi:hypothetical protein